MKFWAEVELDTDRLVNEIYEMSKSQQVLILIEMLRGVDSETARRAVDRYQEDQ